MGERSKKFSDPGLTIHRFDLWLGPMNSGELEARWYVLKTKNKKEKELATRLRLAGFDTYLPLMQGIRQEKPFFPSYIFIHTQLTNPDIYHMIHYTRGVQQILGDQLGPQPILDVIIDSMKDHLSGIPHHERDVLYQAGELVRVRKGVLADVTGIIERKLPDQERVVILYKWMNISLRMKVSYRDLEKVA